MTATAKRYSKLQAALTRRAPPKREQGTGSDPRSAWRSARLSVSPSAVTRPQCAQCLGACPLPPAADIAWRWLRQFGARHEKTRLNGRAEFQRGQDQDARYFLLR